MKKLGLLGRNIGYSFSRNYFGNKFKNENLENDYVYNNFDIQDINELPSILKENPELIGLNVTIPYKEVVIPFLDELSVDAQKIGAVNTIKITPEGKRIGHNTDFFGFNKSIEPLLHKNHKKALILGTGGAAKAVVFGLSKLNIECLYVSRETKQNSITYSQIDQAIFDEYQIIINCSPLGTFPKTELFPDIPYHFFTPNHIAFDLIYNPEKTTFLQKAESYHAVIKNGYDMLVFQAEKAWEVWNQ
jgi:shikimate dehydrogenase